MTDTPERWDFLAIHMIAATKPAGRSYSEESCAWVVVSIIAAFALLGFMAGVLWL